jgi:hypothetical protein
MTVAARRRPRRTQLVLVALVVGLTSAACTPEQFQVWWTAQGNPPMKEPELSRAAAAATAHWREVARKERFTWSVRPIDQALAARMTPSSWRAGCPVPLSSLRYVRVSHMGMDGSERVGEIVLHADAANHAVMAFKILWDDRFPIERMRLIDDYGGNDDASMAANNTSGFNCRRVAGTSTWSQHAYGRAIDINPVQNPYVSGSTVAPPAGSAYLNRSDVRPGMIVPRSTALSAFRRIGWGWGGDWTSAKDYQHVSANGR